MDVRSRVIAIVAEQALLDPADLSDDMTLAEIGVDSLLLVESIFAIEEAFGVTVPLDGAAGAAGFDVATVGGMVASVESLVAGRA